MQKPYCALQFYDDSKELVKSTTNIEALMKGSKLDPESILFHMKKAEEPDEENELPIAKADGFSAPKPPSSNVILGSPEHHKMVATIKKLDKLNPPEPMDNPRSDEPRTWDEEHKSLSESKLPPAPKKDKPLDEQRIKNAHRTIPKEYKEAGAETKDFADIRNHKYPLDTDKRVHSAISYFSVPKNFSMYKPDERRAVWGRIAKACKKFKIDLQAERAKKAGVVKTTKSLNMDYREADAVTNTQDLAKSLTLFTPTVDMLWG